MDKLNKILKNTLIFLAIFLVINYIISSFQNKEKPLQNSNNEVIFTTTDLEYSRRQKVTLNIVNNTKESITIPNECPGEPFNVFRYEENEWVQKSVSPVLNCENAKDTILKTGEEIKIPYNNWNNALFSEMGRFRIEFKTQIDNEEKIITSNEFLIVKEGIIRQIAIGLFYRPIYNAFIFLTAILPKHDLGLATIILTIIIRTILLIPSQKAMVSQRRMQEMQPKLEKIKQQYKGDQQKIATETMSLWKQAKVNPLGSCLPMLLQLPFLIAVFYVIRDGLNPDNSYLLYKHYSNFNIQDININFLGILDLTKINFYVLPLIVGGLQFVQMKLAMQRKAPVKQMNEMTMATNMMTYILPVMIAVFTASLPAGIGIYWGTSTSYGIIQQVFVNRHRSKDQPDNEPKVRVIESKK